MSGERLRNRKVGLVGCGDVGLRLASLLLAEGAEVTGFRRSVEKLPEGITPCRIDITDPASLQVLVNSAFDYVVVTLTPPGMSEAAYRTTYVEGLRAILAYLPRDRQRKLFWVSSSSVYGQGDGSVVDETSPTEPQRFPGRIQREAELLVEPLGERGCIVRFSGIYEGEGHSLLEKLRRGELGSRVESDYYTNRIHRDDCAGVLAHLILRDASGLPLAPRYLASDCEPVLYSELIGWLARETGLPLNPDLSSVTPRTGSKRCCNRRLIESGYNFRYPSFREGFREALALSRSAP
jgi:nucleoside-diphosphate-sugar epimerase